MFPTLNAGAIGVKPSGLADLLDKARRHGFKGAEVWMPEVADLIDRDGLAAVKQMFAAAGVRPGGWGLPTNWRKDDAAFQADLAALPRLARAAAAIGATRTFTWIISFDSEKPFAVNRKFHVDRFAAMAKVLADHGCAVGLEFLGPETIWRGKPHPFIHALEPMLEMAQDIGPNAGILLDCWHWHASGGTLDAIRKTPVDRIVYVHVNDAPKGVAREALIDNVRCLPGETGVIDIAGFLGALKAIGYDGPVVAEPFKKELNDLPSDDARLAAVAAANLGVFRTAGLAG